MIVTIVPFASVKNILQYETKEMTVEDGTSVKLLMEQLVFEQPALKNLKLLFAANKEYVAAEYILNNGDELAIFPPVSGG